MKKDKCARCGYNELTGSLHIHHMDYNHENNSTDNLIVLCANCHFGLHHNKWKLEDIGVYGITQIKRKEVKRINNKNKFQIEEEHKTQLEDKDEIIESFEYETSKLVDELTHFKEKYGTECKRYSIHMKKICKFAEESYIFQNKMKEIEQDMMEWDYYKVQYKVQEYENMDYLHEVVIGKSIV